MASLAGLEAALRGADAAGDIAAATALANEIKRLRPPSADDFRKKAAEEMSFGEAALVGAGRTLDQLGKGVKEMALSVPAAFGHQSSTAELERMRAAEGGSAKEYAALQQARPGATMFGEAGPLLAAPVLGTGFLGMAASAAIPGLISYGTPEERLKKGAWGATGGAVGAGLGNLAGRVLQPNRVAPTVTQQAAEAAAERVGAKLRPGEITGSRPLRWLESSLNDLPLSGGMAQKAERARQAAINQAANRSIGQAGDEVTESTLAAARDTIGSEFRRILNPLEVTLDKTFRGDVQLIANSKVMKALRNEDVEAVIGPFRNLPAGTIKVRGDWFQANKTALDDAVRSAYIAGEPGKARALEAFENALDKAASRSMGKAEREAYDIARKQWANLRLLETGKVVEAGNVMPGRLDSALTTRYKAAYKEGRLSGELPDIGKIAQSFKPLPQSGTTPRAIYSGLAGGAAFAEPMTAAAMIAGPSLAQKFLQSNAGRHYLTKGLLDVGPELERALMLGGAGLLAAPSTLAGP